MRIKKITILRGDRRCDKLYLFVDLPAPFPKMYPNCPVSFTMDIQAGHSEEYCKGVFPGVPLEVMEF